MADHQIDVDAESLSRTRAELGTATIEGTLSEALRRATGARVEYVEATIDALATAPRDDRADAWR